ncbi:MAG: 2Fe-2S iron-sulfur cluster-binding protein [Ignavibacteriales bacterium]|nr:2Fe-2S iron-sulfur cluster-binding protein [Ignavibacteriales bacterium]
MKLKVNGREYTVDGAALEKRLIDYLRDDLDLTGAKNACDIGACGACTVLLNNEPTKICPRYVKELEGASIVTIEGLASADGTLHPLQQAFVDAGAIQCGFCTPGMVLTAHALHQQIINAIEAAAPFYQHKKE